MLTLTGNQMHQAIDNHVGTTDSDVATVVGVLGFSLIGDGSKLSTRNRENILIDGEGFYFRNLIKIPDDRSIHIHISVPIHHKNVGLRGAIVLIRTETNIVFNIGIGNGDEAGSWISSTNFGLIFL